MQARHHRLRKGVNRHFIDALCQPLAPFAAVVGQQLFHGLTFHGMTAVVAVADAIWAFDRSESHAAEDRTLSLAKASVVEKHLQKRCRPFQATS